MTTTFDPVAFKTTTRAQWEARRRGLAPLGPAIEDWLGAATERMLDDVSLATGLARARRRRRRRRPDPRRRPPGRPDRPRARHRHLAHDPGVRRRGAAAPGLTTSTTLEADGEDLSAVRDRSVRRRDLARPG